MLPLNCGFGGSPNRRAEGGYRLPPAARKPRRRAARARAQLSPRRDLAAVCNAAARHGLIRRFGAARTQTAGLRINPRTCASSRFSFGTDLRCSISPPK